MGWAGMIGEGDEIILSIMEHHSNIVPWHFLRERRGAVIKWAPVDDDGNFLVEEYREAVHAAHQDGGDHADVERARHGDAGRRDRPHRPCPRRSGASRRRAERRAPAGRRAGARLRFLRLHRPQGLWPDRDRRALRQEGMARAPSALSGRRRDDPHREPGRRHLQRPAAPLRGGHAGDRRGGGPRRGAGVHDGDRAREDRRARGRPDGLCAGSGSAR